MKAFLAIVATLFAAGSGVAQDGPGYRVDNFDFVNGVRVEHAPKPDLRRCLSSRKSSKGPSYCRATASPADIGRLNMSGSLAGFTTGNSDVDNFILEAGKRNSVDPLLLYSIMHQESTFKPRALSPKGARGLMQLMPGTAARFGVTSIYDPRQNIEGGARYMRFLLDQFGGDINLALAGYNAGEHTVIRYGYHIPPYAETVEYVRRISRRYALIRDPLAAQTASGVTREQLAAVQEKEPKPLTIYERSVFAIRLPDGSLQLVSQ